MDISLKSLFVASAICLLAGCNRTKDKQPTTAEPNRVQAPIPDKRRELAQAVEAEANSVQKDCIGIIKLGAEVKFTKAMSTYWKSALKNGQIQKEKWKAEYEGLSREDQLRLMQIRRSIAAIEKGMEPAHPSKRKVERKPGQVATGPGEWLTESDLEFVEKNGGPLKEKVDALKRKLAGLPPEPDSDQISAELEKRFSQVIEGYAQSKSSEIRQTFISDRENGFSEALSTIESQSSLVGDREKLAAAMDVHLKESWLRCIKQAKESAEKAVEDFLVSETDIEKQVQGMTGRK